MGQPEAAAGEMHRDAAGERGPERLLELGRGLAQGEAADVEPVALTPSAIRCSAGGVWAAAGGSEDEQDEEATRGASARMGREG